MTGSTQRRGHLKKRGNTWTAYWRARNADGISQQRSQGGFTTRAAAERHLTKVYRDLDTGAFTEPDRKARRQTFSQFVTETWLPAISGTVRATTYASYASNLKLHAIPTLGTFRLAEITPQRLNALYASLMSDGRRNGKRGALSPRTVRYVHTIVRRVLSDAVRWDCIPRNPAERADPPKAVRTEMRVWSPADLRSFLASVHAERLNAAWHLLAMTGMRRGEVLGLRWGDLDLDAGKLTVRQTLVVVGYEVTLSSPKTDKGRRRIGLDPATVTTLRAHRARQSQERLAWGPTWADTGLVFTREDGTPFHPQQLSKMFERLVKAAGLPHIRLHDVRHSYATAALQAGVAAKIVSDRLGHSSIAITSDTYQHVLPEMDDQAAVQVAAVILGSREQADLSIPNAGRADLGDLLRTITAGQKLLPDNPNGIAHSCPSDARRPDDTVDRSLGGTQLRS